MAITEGYTLNHGLAYAGMVADAEVNNTVTRLNKTGAPIPYGRFVSTVDFNAMKLAAAGDVIAGVTRRQLDHATPSNGTFAIQDKDDGGVLTMGAIWVEAGEVFAAGDLVKAEVTVGANQGKAIKATDENDALPNAVVTDYYADKQLVQISLKIGG